MNPDITVRYYNSELDWNSLNFRENQAKVLRNVKLVVILDNIFKRDSYLFFLFAMEISSQQMSTVYAK